MGCDSRITILFPPCCEVSFLGLRKSASWHGTGIEQFEQLAVINAIITAIKANEVFS